ncbi:MAG: ABC transporter permease [Planctomycetota bacterium]|nr:ABC transporter permease [Planctomycetota bacterium]
MVGDVALFAWHTMQWLFTRMPRRETLLPAFYQIGVLSLPVVALTGTFIGMVLAVQSYSQFRVMHMETRLGAVINMSLVRELGPVLAATMLAGRVGSAMAAELGTMRVTEQIDALSSMGANPIYYLVVPRFLGCLVLIPILTIMADFMGVVGGAFYSIVILDIDWYHYLTNSKKFVGAFDLFSGVFKSLFFGATIALISCHRGFHCDPGAEGVGRAATSAFVYSFVLILVLDLFLGIGLEALYHYWWPDGAQLV